MIYILYNPLADNRNGRGNAENIGKILETRDVSYLDITGLNAAEFLQKTTPGDKVVLSGGDGTLHHFVERMRRRGTAASGLLLSYRLRE